ncbi:MAG: dienelactone hydrolase family protein [Hyphomonadaceae bacterium]|nr:dienelactone hydrolase family protein [Hyphomonadaceae bacterium]
MLLRTPEGDPPDLVISRRTALASLFTAGYAVGAGPASAQAITTDDAGLSIEEVTFRAAGKYQLPGYLARPAAPGRYPAVIVVNEIFGIHAYIKDVCRRFAKAGYVALAPDYFDRAGDPSTMTDIQNEIRPIVSAAVHEQVMDDTEGAVKFLRRQRYVQRKALAVTGFCWGGAVTWMAASRIGAFKAGVAWYGRLVAPEPGAFGSEEGRPWPVDVAGALKCPVLGLYAAEDRGIPLETVERMRAALAAAGNPSKSEIVVYDGAQHGFHADYRASFRKDAAEDGWARALAWFRANGV